ncbi:DNA-protecting protein DprA [Calidifontibacter sp. DB0510]|uniref:DNA-protecting protein DprA n=1 Tax=Metallococcus carri TaxID=1656884 RepID=A0A967AYV1_9MICO|nr:DNA-processing protein DprA [Metallococcus carri]NHN54335.1 DNA-protecting protein DprA [Metallococcus carri]NOP36825.1 DNA-protecting protein DprA [Calidifontibacter sp. DB2511S]
MSALERVDPAERAARVALSQVVEPLDRVIVPKLLGLSGVEAWDRIVTDAGGQFARCAARVRERHPERLWQIAEKLRVRVVVPGDEEWPPGLDDLQVPPWCLWVRGGGRLTDLLGLSIAVVGSRMSTSYGDHVAGELGHDLSERGWTVVSGAAYGIDAAAHRGALSARRPTIAALACGVDRSYPAAHAELLEVIRGDGALVSEMPPGAAPQKHRFLARNRLIAALTRGTVVVEAGLRSGSLNTATHAEALARPVGAVPGPVTSAMSAGCHELVREGKAVLVSDARDVIELAGAIGGDLAPPRRGQIVAADRLGEEAQRVLFAMPARGSTTVDRLTRSAGLTVPEVLRSLACLEGAGEVQRSDDGWRLP